MKILVIGGTGTVGSQVVRELLACQMDVRVLTRSADKAKSLPAGAQGVTGDLLDPGTVRSVFRGMDGVFLLSGVSTTETHEGLMALNGIRMSGLSASCTCQCTTWTRRCICRTSAPSFPSRASSSPQVSLTRSCGPIISIKTTTGLRTPCSNTAFNPQPFGDLGASPEWTCAILQRPRPLR